MKAGPTLIGENSYQRRVHPIVTMVAWLDCFLIPRQRDEEYEVHEPTSVYCTK